MAIEIPTTEPARVRAGDTVTWQKSLPDYPATEGWVLHYRGISAAARFDIASTASGADHLVSEAPTATDDWSAGEYSLISWVTLGSDRVTLPSRSIVVLPNLAAVTAAGYDGRSQARKMLDAIDAALLSFATGERLAVVEAELAGRRMRYDLSGLHRLRNVYAAAVRAEDDAERVAAGLAPRSRLSVRL